MRIVLLGTPGSGKGTQAVLMVDRLSIPHISTGMLLRNAAKKGTELGLKAKAFTDRGLLTHVLGGRPVDGILERILSVLTVNRVSA